MLLAGFLLAAAAAAAPQTIAVSTSPTMAELLSGIETAYRAGRYEDGLKLVKRTLESGSPNLSVYDRVGSIYLRLGRYGEAIATWEQALRLEKRAGRRQELERSIASARRSLGLPEPAPARGGTYEPSPLPSPAEGGRGRTDAKPRKRKPPVDKEGSERFYDQGVQHYAQGEYLQSWADFTRALELDPDNALAKSALARLKLKVAPSASDSGKHGNTP